MGKSIKSKSDEKSKQTLLSNNSELSTEKFRKHFDSKDFEDDNYVKCQILQFTKNASKFNLLDFGHCIRESRTLKLQIRDSSSQFIFYERSMYNIESLIKKFHSSLKPLLSIKSKFFSHIRDILAKPEEKEVHTVLEAFDFEHGTFYSPEEEFYLHHLQEIIDNHKDLFKRLNKIYNEYEKNSIVYESSTQRKNAYSPVAKSAGMGNDTDSNQAAKAYFLAQLDLVHIINKIKLTKEFFPYQVTLSLTNILCTEDTVPFQVEMNKPTLIEHDREYDLLMLNLDYVYSAYTRFLDSGEIPDYMFGMPEGYLAWKGPKEKTFPKRSWCFIEHHSLVEYNKKSERNTVIIRDINKVIFKPAPDDIGKLTFECLQNQEIIQFRCDTEFDVRMWLNGLEAIRQESTNPLNTLPEVKESSDPLACLKGKLTNKRNSSIASKSPIKEKRIALRVLGNTVCADCNKKNTEWLSLNLGVCLCYSCSGKHRGLTTRISKVRSLKMDELDPLTEEMMSQLGNKLCNIINEFSIDKNTINAARQDPNFFKDKYEFKKFLPKSEGEWEDLKTDYIKNVKEIFANVDNQEEIKIFEEILASGKCTCENLSKFKRVTFVYFLLRKSDSLEFPKEEVIQIVKKCIKSKSVEILALLFYSGVNLTDPDENGENIVDYAKAEQYDSLLEFLKTNYIFK